MVVSEPAMEASEIHLPSMFMVAKHLPMSGPPTGSMVMSGGFALSVATRSSVKRLLTTSAPTDLQNSPFASLATCATTFAPKTCFASWMQATPRPPSPPLMKNVSPFLISPTILRFRYAVAYTSGMPAASHGSKPFGRGRHIPSGTTACSAYPPPPRRAHTLSPGLKRPLAGASSTVPAHSRPGQIGHPSGGA